MFKHFGYQSIVLALLWLAGTIKPFLYAYFFEFDIVVFMMLIAVIDMLLSGGLSRLNPNHYVFKLFFVIILIFAWILISNIYTPSLGYGIEKTLAFTGNIIFFLYPVMVKKIDFDIIIKVYLLLFLPIAIFFVYMLSIVWSSQSTSVEIFMNLRGNYLSVGFSLGLLFLMLNYFNKNIWLQLVVFLLLVASSARGPLIFVIIVLIFLNAGNLVSYIQNSKVVLKISGVLLIVIASLFYFSGKFTSLLESSFRRFSSLSTGEDVSALARYAMMDYAFFQPFSTTNTIFTVLFGNGIGSFGILYSGRDERLYPHNMLLEVLFELGLVGIILFLILFVLVFRKLSIRNNIFSVLFIFSLLNAMKSSSLSDLWIFFSLLSGVTLSKIVPTKKLLN